VDDVNGWDFFNLAGGQDNDPNPDLGDGNDNDGDGFRDENVSHGTIVAGVAGAVGNNSTGVAGAAWNVKLMALKVFRDDGGAPDSAVLAAIDYAISKRAHVINLSLGSDNVHCPTSDPLFEAAITSAFNAGVLVVVAAGNDNTNRPGSPDSCTHALAVGGSDHNSTDFLAVSGLPKDPRGRAFFSNFSPFVSVVAPAVSLASTSVSSQADENAGGFLKGTHLTLVGAFGTSFSAPLVSGLAALIISRGKDLGLNLTPTQVRALIENHAVDLPDDSNDSPDAGATWDGKGRVNFRASVSAITTVTTCTPPASGNWVVAESCTFVGSATAPANVIVDVEVALTIAGGASLDINFSTNHLRIKNGAKVVIKSGGKIR
jgi:subtilisin family serine protease